MVGADGADFQRSANLQRDWTGCGESMEQQFSIVPRPRPQRARRSRSLSQKSTEAWISPVISCDQGVKSMRIGGCEVRVCQGMSICRSRRDMVRHGETERVRRRIERLVESFISRLFLCILHTSAYCINILNMSNMSLLDIAARSEFLTQFSPIQA